MQKTCIIIPCFNEVKRLSSESFLSFALQNPSIHFLFVNDGSSDNTKEILFALAEQNAGQFHFIDRKINLGKAETVREGIQKSFLWEDFDLVGYLDADLSTPLTEIDWLLKEFKNPDLLLVSGSRKKTNSNKISRNIIRHYFGRIYAFCVTSALSINIYDTQCGAKIFRAATAKEVFNKPFMDRWLFDVEIFCRMKKQYAPNLNLVTKEVTLRDWQEKGHSKIRLTDLIKLPVQTFRIVLKYL